MKYVLDSSLCLAFIMPDENSDKVNDFFAHIDHEKLFVPHLWWYEIANALKSNMLRKRITIFQIEDCLSILSGYDFITDSSTGHEYVQHVVMLADQYKLSAYDAAYIELALREDAILGTLDDLMKKAGTDAGLAVAEVDV